MKTLTKKILTVCLTLAMACALAIPAFADFDNGYNGYHIRNESIGGNNYLNMEGSGGPYNSRNVTVYSRTGDGDQIWSIANRGNGKKVYNSKTDSAGNAYTLNINSSNNNCNVYRDLSSNNNDSVVSNAGNMPGIPAGNPPTSSAAPGGSWWFRYLLIMTAASHRLPACI